LLSRAELLELRELETRSIELTAAQAVELAQLTRGGLNDSTRPRVIQQVTPSSRTGWYDVQPGPFVGRFSLPSGLTVDIASRFAFTDLLHLLRVAARQPVLLDAAPTPARAGHGLLELIATAFIREMRRIVGFGLAKGYVSRTFTRPPYPGVPDATAHLAKHLGRPDRLVTHARRLTVDIPVNQVLAAAQRILRSQTYTDPTLSVRLRSLTPTLTDITAVPDGLRLATAAGHDVPNRYREAFGLAILVLAGLTTLPTGTGAAGVSVLFNMPKVWESYVQAALEPKLPTGHRLSAQHPVLLTTDASNIRASADLVELDAHGNEVAVYDAKYKPWGTNPSTDEIYQTLTYAYRLGLDSATLLYPGRGERNEIVVGEYRIRTVGVDVLRPVSPAAE
jgi:5-methylcytosine-specific restriction endonuclease McrBC regulatory subunit McrC